MFRWSALAAFLLISQSLLAASKAPNGWPPAPNGWYPFYAYVTDTRFVLAVGDRVISRYLGNFSETSRSLTWTIDGRYVAVLAGSTHQEDPEDFDTYDRRVVVVDAVTATQREFDCFRCTSIAPLDGSRILGIQQNNWVGDQAPSVLVFDLDSSWPPVALSVGENVAWRKLALLGGMEGRGLAVGLEKTGGYTQARNLFFAWPNGRLQNLGSLPGSSHGIGTVASTPKDVTGHPTHAIQGVTDLGIVDGDPCLSESVSVVDGITGSVTATDTSAINRGNNPDGAVRRVDVHSLWWHEGYLNGLMESTDCHKSIGGAYVNSALGFGRLVGTNWVKAEPPVALDNLLSINGLRDGTLVTLADDRTTNSGNRLALYDPSSGNTVRIADFVYALSVPPLGDCPCRWTTRPTPNQDPSQEEPPASTPTARASTTVNTSPVPVLVDEPAFKAQGTYVKFSGVPGLEGVNDAVARLVSADLDRTNETAERLRASSNPPGDDVVTYEVNTETVSVTSDIVSVLLRVSWASSRGAVVNDYWLSLTTTIPRATMIEIKDLFTSPNDVAPLLADLTKQASRTSNACLRSAIGDSLSLDSSNWYDLATYDTFALTAAGLLVAFNDYDIGPGACGATTITIPWSGLDAALNVSTKEWVDQLR